jgi:hypothetical protein
MALSAMLGGAGERILPPGIVPFPRGFAFSGDGARLLSSGIGPNGEGDNTIVAFAPGQNLKPSRLVFDPELSPLDLAAAPNGNIVVSSEHPFGLADAVTSVREYGATDGQLFVSSQPVDRPSSADPAVCAHLPRWHRVGRLCVRKHLFDARRTNQEGARGQHSPELD